MSLSALSPAWLSSAWGYMQQQVDRCRHGIKAKEDALGTASAAVNDPDFSTLPSEVIFQILQNVDANDLGQAARVCRRFCEAASEDRVWTTLSFKQLFPPLSKGVTHIDRAVWKECGVLDEYGLDISGEVEVRPYLDKVAYLRIRKLITPPPAKQSLINWLYTFPRKDGKKGITILTMPKGLTLRKLKTIFDAKHPGANDPKLTVWNPIMTKFGDLPVDRTYTVILTNNVFTRSRDKSIKEQLDLLEVVGCKIPKALQLTTLLVMRYLSSQEQPRLRLYEDVFTRTEEMIEMGGKETRVVLGAFVSSGPSVYCDADVFGDNHSGVAGAWEFPAIES